LSERNPAIGLLEFASIAIGIDAADAMVKTAPVAAIRSGTVHPGKYLVLVHGDTASVEIALETGRGAAVAEVFLADVAPAVPVAMAAGNAAEMTGEAIGVVETSAVAAAIAAADAGVKAAAVGLAALRLADGLGGKGYLIFSGTVAEVEAAVDAAISAAADSLLASIVVPRLHVEMADNLAADLRFGRRMRSGRLD
jgi:microcompartment protein CcmL/EutN